MGRLYVPPSNETLLTDLPTLHIEFLSSSIYNFPVFIYPLLQRVACGVRMHHNHHYNHKHTNIFYFILNTNNNFKSRNAFSLGKNIEFFK